ncbi:hypothetical protein DIURU_004036 [Diutina rugosa]|uniref:Uncharacterized protein n=1 Tax=Diutina rugosa TaxID=5481 RepID=A0A642UIQ6_DIURU|nr:uncharacterized protein DIURU_004036 [Diutina rugosa]KAA8899779.1 hypothetical protein DIURU_004036 [Diutina rugosa]
MFAPGGDTILATPMSLFPAVAFDSPQLRRFLQSLPTGHDRQCVFKYLILVKRYRADTATATSDSVASYMAQKLVNMFRRMPPSEAEGARLDQMVTAALAAFASAGDDVFAEYSHKLTNPCASPLELAAAHAAMNIGVRELRRDLVLRLEEIYSSYQPLSPVDHTHLWRVFGEVEKRLCAEDDSIDAFIDETTMIFADANVTASTVERDALSFTVNKGGSQTVVTLSF